VNIAYWSVGEGDPVVLMGSIWGAIAITSVFPIYAEIRDSLLDSGLRVIIYDGRGTGSSQRDALDFSLEAKVLDLEAVINHLELRNPAVLGINHATPPAVAFAAAHPGRLSKLVLVGPYTNGHQYFSSTPTLRSLVAMEKLAESEWEVYVKMAAASVTGFTETPSSIDQMAAMMLDGMTQEGYLLFRNAAVSVDVTDMLSDVRAPTLVVHFESSGLSSSDIAQHVASSIQGAELVATEDTGSAIRDFLAPGKASASNQPQHQTADVHTILFTDMEGSTTLANRLGDAGAQEVKRTHNGIVRAALSANAGSEVKHTGDGIMASFSTASSGLDAAIAIQRGVAAHKEEHPDSPLAVYVGINAGEPIAEEDDLFGTSINLAARLVDHAGPGQIIASDVVRQLAAGKDFLFSDLGETELRGFEDPVKLWELRWQDAN
jgi:class 3 adenylate cyclase